MVTLETAAILVDAYATKQDTLHLPFDVCRRFLDQTDRVQEAGLKSYGLFVSDPTHRRHPYTATDVIVLDPHRNRRNDEGNRAAFEAQGDYFRRYDDAGFVADPAELLAAYRRIDDAGLEIVGVFHTHRRQPPNFSTIDFRLHNPLFPWHMIVSYARGRAELAAFGVVKTSLDMGIDEADDRQGSEQAYLGPEVRPLRIEIGRP